MGETMRVRRISGSSRVKGILKQRKETRYSRDRIVTGLLQNYV